MGWQENIEDHIRLDEQQKTAKTIKRKLRDQQNVKLNV